MIRTIHDKVSEVPISDYLNLVNEVATTHNDRITEYFLQGLRGDSQEPKHREGETISSILS